MSQADARNYFIVKHDLESFKLLPGVIWRTDKPPTDVPRGMQGIQVGDRWIEFAYKVDELNNKRCTLVVGFYECVKTPRYERVPLDEATLARLTYWSFYRPGKAWMIKGTPYKEQPDKPTDIGSISKLLDLPHFAGQTLVPIKDDEFERIRNITLARCQVH